MARRISCSTGGMIFMYVIVPYLGGNAFVVRRKIDMGPTFWIGLAIGAIVSLIASLFANYLTPTFSDFMNRGRASFVERSRKKALRKYAEVEELHSGKFDRYFFIVFITIYSQDQIYMVSAILAACLFLVIKITYIMLNMGLVQSRLTDFEQYKQKTVERWGSMDQSS
jgi:H+/gluconate symporter-like permease